MSSYITGWKIGNFYEGMRLRYFNESTRKEIAAVVKGVYPDNNLIAVEADGSNGWSIMISPRMITVTLDPPKELTPERSGDPNLDFKYSKGI